MKLTKQDSILVADAIRAAEARTDGEIAAIVAGTSDSYHDVVLHWSLIVALLPLSVTAAFPQLLLSGAALVGGGWEEPSLRLLLTTVLTASVALFLIARPIIGRAQVRMALTPAVTKTRRVRRRAVMLFRTGTEQRTATSTGVLLYLSMAEHRAEIVADAAIHSRVDPALWGEAMAVLIAAVRDDRAGEGIAAAIEKIGNVLAAHFPRGNDPNELPDRLIIL